jgi:uncharacterized protein (DUF1684 family)
MDWKRTVFDLYRRVRTASDPRAAWRDWTTVRDDLFKNHPQSPLPFGERASFGSLPYFAFDPDARVFASVRATEPEVYNVPTSGDEQFSFTRVGIAEFGLGGKPLALELYWLEGYGGGLFLPFRDATSGSESYGAGRYILDTIKGADLGRAGDRLVLDFNFAYNPSCAYDAKWVCPLAPPANRLDLPIRAGERH